MAGKAGPSSRNKAGSSTEDRMQQLSSLLEQLSLCEERLERVEVHRDKVRPEVYEKVRTEYAHDLAEVRRQVEPLRAALGADLERLKTREAEIAVALDAASMELEELMLRHLAGELADKAYQTEAGGKQANIENLGVELAELRGQIIEMARASGSQVAPSARAVAEPKPVPAKAQPAPVFTKAPAAEPVRIAPAPPAPAPVLAPVVPAVPQEQFTETDLEEDDYSTAPYDEQIYDDFSDEDELAGPRNPAPDHAGYASSDDDLLGDLDDLPPLEEAFEDEGGRTALAGPGVLPLAPPEPTRAMSALDEDEDFDIPDDFDSEGGAPENLYQEPAPATAVKASSAAPYLDDLEDLDEDELLADLDDYEESSQTMMTPEYGDADLPDFEDEPGTVMAGDGLTPKAILFVEEGDAKGVEFIMEKNEITIGRGPDNDIQLPNDTSISRHHARIAQENGQFVVTDLDSSNGTLVNGQPITRKVLALHDKILVGQTLLTLLPGAGSR
ncbi:MAG: FHA domain-containing protein [Candidatus Schekmanbacteria bacterium]|nr:FHA domain-containing protein [Candidatus Schekmanbacteria bacterium]